MSDAVMPDAMYAKRIIEFVWPPDLHSRGWIIAAAFKAVKQLERSYPRAVRDNRKRQWTERRIRSIVDDEAPALEHYEVSDLEKMAVREGKDAYRKSIERSARIAAFLAHADEAFHGPQIEAQLAMAGALAGAGAGLATDGSHAVGEGADRQGERAGDIRSTRDAGANG